ncbi:hypothetical protein [Micromonospora wenchangensis]|uniref:hypothetical protein n=1 Tax=Micromonospora wenchangensis TaxID=1185415 RepID=UPI003D752D88
MMHLAYLDAGSGSLIVQAVVGGAAGAAVAAKLYWRRVTARFRREPAEASPSERPGGPAGTTAPDRPATAPDRPATAPAEDSRADRQPRQPAGN